MPRHKRVPSLGLGLLLCLCAAPVIAASFDCGKAGTPVERILCADPELGLLDERMADAYRMARESADDDPDARAALGYLAIPFSGSDYRGGAHGMPLMAVLILDLASGAPIAAY